MRPIRAGRVWLPASEAAAGLARARFLAGFVACAGLLAYAIYTQYYGGLLPCPLCTFQRGAFIVLGVVFLLGGLFGPKRRGWRAFWTVLALLPALAGIGIAGRHVWLQHLPADQVPACGPDLSYMMQAFPFADVIRKVFTGSGECAKVDWTFLGMAMPACSLIWFVLLAVWALLAGLSRRR